MGYRYYLIASKLNNLSRLVLLLSFALLPIVMQIPFYIFPDYKLPSILYLVQYSNFKITSHNILYFSTFSGCLILLLTLPYWILNTVNIILVIKNLDLNIDLVYKNFDSSSILFKLCSLSGIIFFLLFFLNYINLIQLTIPFAPTSMILGISRSKIFLFIFSFLFDIIGIGYCINILVFMLFLMLKILRG